MENNYSCICVQFSLMAKVYNYFKSAEVAEV